MRGENLNVSTMATQNGSLNGTRSGNSDLKDTLVLGQTSQGLEVHGTLVRLTRHTAVLEVYNSAVVLRMSEVIDKFKIIVRDRTIYSGRAVVRSLVNAGLTLVCEVTLSENAWMDVAFTEEALAEGKLRDEFDGFVTSWQKNYKVSSEFKVAVADIQTFLLDLRGWTEQIELGIRSSPKLNSGALERSVIDALSPQVISALDSLFEKFENIAASLPDDMKPSYRNYIQRQLHPIVLCAPFAYRSYAKPLGYAGDYEMINMMLGDPRQGGSLFAKIFNVWLLHQGSAAAHRNRIRILTRRLSETAAAAARRGHPARILSLGCGPAWEIREFLTQSELSNNTAFTLLDFDEETLRHTSDVLQQVIRERNRTASIQLTRRSVHQLLRNAVRGDGFSGRDTFDLIYCAGLFDYLSDRTCRQLLNIFYDWLSPQGLVLISNITKASPNQSSLELILDWHLNYRDTGELKLLAPESIPADQVRLHTDETGVNLFLEARKPNGDG
jgi:extracellular factor (EF) 3-hydroxypalmitic acid methyl ester biosynthesis protein